MSEKYSFIAAEQAGPTHAPSSDSLSDSLSVVVRAVLPVVLMCAVLGVSTSGYYGWLRAEPSARARRRATIAVHVQAAFTLGRGMYGARRVHAVLRRSDDPQVASASLDLVRDLMRELGLRACQPRSYKTTTLQDPGSNPEPVIADHVGRDFTAPAPGCKLVGDITYIRTGQGWLYLATVIDCFSRAVVGWSMAEHMRTDLICDAITMASTNVAFSSEAVFHSDRGTQYTSGQFAKHLRSFGITGSMGRTGVCWDNALAESFFGTVKVELVNRTIFPDRQSARTAIAEYIEVFYNRQRLHSALGYKTPQEVTDEYRQYLSLAA